ncbi:amino acid ABC transporter permease [Mesorhizobium sp. BR1-1-3]|jgi:polar amino acid transport system permease protein|uniref:amino acid ABC transporter permease n=1 Tax=unclassified Mesorhizobium TaxID=325217 RepID=UPI000F75D53A|nr:MULTISPECIES: amino acid ABC transporter permease [unclassified Mesorhizobium]RWE30080.1 MAG: ABC transporter permease subunit [Mesorhizobium sp.]AZO45274.1 amino acid ABC transporter permease [Mesorhizobium sp. M7D.F.Ca.US.005.01.1.1]MBZ9887592.1 amino acid ABC transporter permease [Mesorhizobium sp. BR1-1-3]TGP88032.1 amino acid ABC transporter permease [Mesorhizobium sp. M8A.F.Ca.ET.218.01.1.1]TGT15830.1 amino acid ABC transporter permease [Mesorhizobium sp. M8A.F.Ca.ET.213.01.1.1]
MNFEWGVFWEYLFWPSSVYLHGLWLTLSISVVAQGFGTVLGLFIALARISKHRLLQVPARIFVWGFRGTPLLVQIVFIYTGLAAANIFRFEDINLGFATLPGNLQAGLLALTLNEAAYMAEIIRAGINSVNLGQTEASKSLGMTYGLYMRRIILPQAARVVVPPLGNEFNSMLKNTTLLSVIGVPELLLATQMVTSVTFRVFELYMVVACYYLTLTTLWGFVQQRLESRFGDPAAAASRKLASKGYRRLFGFGQIGEPR